MSILREFRSENQAVNNIIERASQTFFVQGVIIEMNPIWLYLWRLNETYGSDWLEEKFNFTRYYRRYPDLEYYADFLLEKFVIELADIYLKSDSWIPIKKLTLNEFNQFYEQFANAFYRLDRQIRPFALRICTNPNYETKPIEFEVSNEIRNFDIIYEARPISYLYNDSQKLHKPVIGGTSISTGDRDFGTLGGILHDTSCQKFYGITCSHVVELASEIFHPAKYDSSKSMKIGEVVHKSVLSPLPVNFYQTKNLSAANEMDVALIEILEPAVLEILHIGSVASIFPEDLLVPNGQVNFVGRSSGHKQFLYADPDIVFYDLYQGAERFRYKDLMQIRQDGKIANFISTPTLNGDSGAWLCTPYQNGPAWCGMIIGGYGQTAFAISAEKIMTYLNNNTALQLSLT